MSEERRTEDTRLRAEERRLRRRVAELEATAAECERLKAALRESQDRYRRLRDNIPGMIYTFRLDADGRPTFPYVSSASRELFGLEPEDLMQDGTLVSGLRHPDDVELVDREMMRCREEQRPFRMEIRHVIDGEVRWHDCISRPVSLPDGSLVWDGIMMEVTERNLAELALRESEERFRAVVDQAADALFLTIQPEGRVVDVNQRACDSLGYSREELLSMSFLDFDVGFDRQRAEELYEEELSAGRPITLEGVHRRKDGSCFPVEVRVGVVELEGQLMTLALARDITERRAAEAERESLIAQLEAKNLELEKKNAALERYAYTVSHDLKNPLLTICVFTGALRQHVARAELDRMEADLGRIDGAAKMMQRLLEDLLQLSRVGQVTGPAEMVPLGDLVHEVLELLAGPLRTAGLTVEFQPGPPSIWGNRGQLRDVLQNLVENAVKFLGDQPEPRIVIGAEEREHEVRCWVADNGTGVDPRYHDKIFGLFEKLVPQLEGSGIGLALVRRIVEEHGGRVWIESEGEGRGSTFSFTLPKPAAAS